MTAGGQVREQELMASLQMLLEKVEKGQLTLGPGKDNMWSRYFTSEVLFWMAACGELAVRPRGTFLESPENFSGPGSYS